MPTQRHPGLSEADVEAAEVLDELRNGIVAKKSPPPNIGSLHGFQTDKTSNKIVLPPLQMITSNQSIPEQPIEQQQQQPVTLLDRVVNNVGKLYDDLSNRKKVASIARLLDDAYEDNYTTSEDDSDSDSDSGSESESESERGRDDNKGSQLPLIQQQALQPNKKAEKRSYEEDSDIEDNDNNINDNNDDTISIGSSEYVFSKRQKISEAIDNFKEYKFNMSIESKKRLITCLHLLKLATKQLSEKVTNLQDLVQKEQDPEYINNRMHSHHAHMHKILHPHKDTSENRENSKVRHAAENITVKKELEEEDDEFFDAFDATGDEEQATIIKMEVVGTIKKVYSMISRFTGSSLPEPARSQVRETLLNLPTKWSSSVSNFDPVRSPISHAVSTINDRDVDVITGSKNISNHIEPSNHTEHYPSDSTFVSANGKVLILAKESLDVVQNVMDVVDSTLGKAEEWVKQKQEIKELLYEKFRESKVKKER